MEISTGVRPGRPHLAFILSFVALLGALALAQLQSTAKRSLSDEVAIPGAPLALRLPTGWLASEETPGLFFPDSPRARSVRLAYLKAITIRYERRPFFTPLFRSTTPARIGAWPAVLEQRVDRSVIPNVSLLELTAYSPRGDVVQLTLQTRLGINQADYGLLDAVARSVRVTDPALERPADDVLQQMGLALPLDESWRIAPAAFGGVSSLHFGGTIGGLPRWAVSIHRTWLGPGRDAAALAQASAAALGDLASAAPMGRIERDDNADAVVVAIGERGLTHVAVIAAGASEAVICHAFAMDPDARGAAERALRRIATEVRFEGESPFAAFDRARAKGAELVSTLRQRGPAAWWGREPSFSYYVSRSIRDGRVAMQCRATIAGDPQQGYVGASWEQDASTTPSTAQNERRWLLDAETGGYQEIGSWYERDRLGAVRQVRSRREVQPSSSAPVTIELAGSGAQVERSLNPTDVFIARPLEAALLARVAANRSGPALIEATVPDGIGVQFRWVESQPNAADDEVWVWSDIWPCGTRYVFDEDGWPIQVERPHLELQRVSRNIALRRTSALPDEQALLRLFADDARQ